VTAYANEKGAEAEAVLAWADSRSGCFVAPARPQKRLSFHRCESTDQITKQRGFNIFVILDIFNSVLDTFSERTHEET